MDSICRQLRAWKSQHEEHANLNAYHHAVIFLMLISSWNFSSRRVILRDTRGGVQDSNEHLRAARFNARVFGRDGRSPALAIFFLSIGGADGNARAGSCVRSANARADNRPSSHAALSLTRRVAPSAPSFSQSGCESHHLSHPVSRFLIVKTQSSGASER